MTCDYLALAHPSIQKLKPYQPGKPIEELERELGITNIIKLASNENPLGPSPKAIEALQSTLSNVHLYPDGSGYLLKQALSTKYGVSSDKITLGNGSDSLFGLLAQAYVDTKTEVVFTQYAFISYLIATLSTQGIPKIAPTNDFKTDVDALLAQVTDKTRLLFLANPNNPTGTWVKKQEINYLLDNLPENIIFILDEAYYEYMNDPEYPDSISLMDKYPNLVITRTFSKIYGLAGLRVGYALSHPDIADILNRIRPPFNVNVPALKAAEVALSDEDHLNESLKINKTGMSQLIHASHELNLKYIESAGNFLTIEFGKNADMIYQKLLEQGIIVRPLAGYKMPTMLRVTIGLPDQMEYLINILSSLLRS